MQLRTHRSFLVMVLSAVMVSCLSEHAFAQLQIIGKVYDAEMNRASKIEMTEGLKALLESGDLWEAWYPYSRFPNFACPDMREPHTFSRPLFWYYPDEYVTPFGDVGRWGGSGVDGNDGRFVNFAELEAMGRLVEIWFFADCSLRECPANQIKVSLVELPLMGSEPGFVRCSRGAGDPMIESTPVALLSPCDGFPCDVVVPAGSSQSSLTAPAEIEFEGRTLCFDRWYVDFALGLRGELTVEIPLLTDTSARSCSVAMALYTPCQDSPCRHGLCACAPFSELCANAERVNPTGTTLIADLAAYCREHPKSPPCVPSLESLCGTLPGPWCGGKSLAEFLMKNPKSVVALHDLSAHPPKEPVIIADLLDGVIRHSPAARIGRNDGVSLRIKGASACEVVAVDKNSELIVGVARDIRGQSKELRLPGDLLKACNGAEQIALLIIPRAESGDDSRLPFEISVRPY